MSNDPFADPPVTSTPSSASRRQSMAAGSPNNNADPTDPSASRSTRNSLAVPLTPGGNVHRRVQSSDPMGLTESPANSTPVHGRHESVVSADPTAVETPKSATKKDSQGDFATEEEEKPKKKGWSLFKSKEEKEIEELEKQQTEARKKIDAEHEKEWKDEIKGQKDEIKKHWDSVEKEYKKLREKLEAEYDKIRSEIKKERKTEIEAHNKTYVDEYKATKKLVKERKAAEKKAAEEDKDAKPEASDK